MIRIVSNGSLVELQGHPAHDPMGQKKPGWLTRAFLWKLRALRWFNRPRQWLRQDSLPLLLGTEWLRRRSQAVCKRRSIRHLPGA